MMYRVKEIFKSIQGEGFSGKEAVFLRFTGCNLWNGRKKIGVNQFAIFVILTLWVLMEKMEGDII